MRQAQLWASPGCRGPGPAGPGPEQVQVFRPESLESTLSGDSETSMLTAARRLATVRDGRCIHGRRSERSRSVESDSLSAHMSHKRQREWLQSPVLASQVSAKNRDMPQQRKTTWILATSATNLSYKRATNQVCREESQAISPPLEAVKLPQLSSDRTAKGRALFQLCLHCKLAV